MAGDLITVFISYAHEDAELARAIQQRLEVAGFKVWIDEGALRAGDSLIQSIATAIHEMEFVVALITDASVDSRWCQHEIRLAMTSGLNREGRRCCRSGSAMCRSPASSRTRTERRSTPTTWTRASSA